MTPERKEEIKKKYKNMDYFTMQHTVGLLLAALEEAQQQLRSTQITSSVHEGNSDAYFAECERLRGGLAEAQQTIARQSAALGWYELGKPELARAALGEGAKEETFSFPNCPSCNGNRTIAHPSKAGTWLCVPCDKVFEEGSDKE